MGSSGETSGSHASGPTPMKRSRKRTAEGPSNPPPPRRNSCFFPMVEPEIKDFSERIGQLPHEVLVRIFVNKIAPEPPKRGTEQEWVYWYAQLAGVASAIEAGPQDISVQNVEENLTGQKGKKKGG